ncbi:hypothetical protein FHL15_006733 [Xylaria flabelliformis]|uniref:Uncharacterized protein n=1 Tax=Xylaria flabelliformis TaxID=2512241 RepID=A0A553HWN9_9PEZI|nr:hypothetical protein FHL15_006733 [Xylaria flabelliformis]
MSLPRSAPRYDEGPEVVYPSTLEPAPVTELGLDAPQKHVSLCVLNKTYADNQSNPRLDALERRRRIVCGMPTSTSFLAIALIVIVIAAGVGGGVGGSIAVKNAKRSCATATASSLSASSTPVPTRLSASSTSTTATSSSPFAVKTNVLLPLDCPGLDSTPQSSTFAHRTSTFQMYCRKDPVYDMNQAILSIACVSFNHYADSDNCTAASFYANMTAVVPTAEANCYLRTGTGLTLDDNSEGDHLIPRRAAESGKSTRYEEPPGFELGFNDKGKVFKYIP